MIVQYENLEEVVRPNLKNGVGNINIKEYIHKDNMTNCRLVCEQAIPIGGSIGRHTHIRETEYYIITKGKGKVIEKTGEYAVSPGDLVMTGHREMHSIENTGNEPLIMIAMIVTH